jgi:LDH2 family malate/lactate/ureidoglycolate dehydrogenase
MNRRRSGESLPNGWASDEQGQPTSDPALARMLEPSGGYKGYGLGMMVEILCAMLADGPLDKDILPMYGSPLDATRNISHFFMAINVGDFVDLERFRQRMRQLASRIRSLEPQTTMPVMISGDPEKRAFELRSRDGIPVDDQKYAEFIGISASFAEAVRA